MALVVGENTFVTLAEADAYHADRKSATAWGALSAGDREKNLVSAYDQISVSCELSFDPATEEIPTLIKQAQSELAYQKSKLEVVDEISGTKVTELKAGPATIKLDYEETSSDGMTVIINQMLAKGGADCDFSSGSITIGTVEF